MPFDTQRYKHKGFDIVCRKCTKEHWDRTIAQFADASIYQSFAYGDMRWGADSLKHVEVSHNGQLVAACQCAVVKLPIISSHIAYASMAPMWNPINGDYDPAYLKTVLWAMKQHFVTEMSVPLKVSLTAKMSLSAPTFEKCFERNSFTKTPSSAFGKTSLLDVNPPLEKLRASLHKRWREKLNRSNRNELEVIHGTSDGLFSVVIDIYHQMRRRKHFASYADIADFRAIQSDLPENLKMNVMICKQHGKPIAGLVYSAIGDTAVALFSATADIGLTLYGSYLLRWEMVEAVKKLGVQYIDQGGIDEKNNPGGYNFKTGMGGAEVTYAGPYYACKDGLTRRSIIVAEQVRTGIRNIEQKVSKVLHR